MTTHSDYEQFMLELINRARSNPSQEIARIDGIDDLNQGLEPDTLSNGFRPPVFANEHLIEAARDHSNWMLALNRFTEQGQAGASPLERMQDAGYLFAAFPADPIWGENRSLKATTGSLPSSFTEYVLEQHERLFLSAEDRVNLLNADFREIGIGQRLGQFEMDDESYKSSMITQDFAASDGPVFLGGVVYEDGDEDEFYTPGEGVGNLTVSLPDLGLQTKTSSAGGYQLAVPTGTHQVVFSGPGLADAETRTLTISNRNRKLDLVLEVDEPPWTLDPVDYASRFIEALAEAYAETQAGGAAANLNSALVGVFAGLLSRQLTPDSEQGGLQPNDAFDTLAPVFTFVATDTSSRPPTGPMGYAPAMITEAHAAARVESSSGQLSAGQGSDGFALSSGEFVWDEPVEGESDGELGGEPGWDSAPAPDLPEDDSGPAASLAAYADWAFVG